MQKREPSYIDWELVGTAVIALAFIIVGLLAGFLIAMWVFS